MPASLPAPKKSCALPPPPPPWRGDVSKLDQHLSALSPGELARALNHESLELEKGKNKVSPVVFLMCHGHDGHLGLLLGTEKYARVIDERRYSSGTRNTLLHSAVQTRSHAAVKYLLDRKHFPQLDVNRKNFNGNRAFNQACDLGFSEIIAELLGDDRVEVHHWFKGFTSPLNAAVLSGSVASVKVLLGDPRFGNSRMANQADRGGVTPFLAACESGQAEIVRYFVELVREREMRQYDAGFPPLIDITRRSFCPGEKERMDGHELALKMGHREVARILEEEFRDYIKAKSVINFYRA